MDNAGEKLFVELIENLKTSLDSFNDIIYYMTTNDDIANAANVALQRASVQFVHDNFQDALNKHKAKKLN